MHSFNLTRAECPHVYRMLTFRNKIKNMSTKNCIIIISFDVHPDCELTLQFSVVWYWCSCCWPSIAPCEKQLVLAEQRKGLGGNGELNNKSKYLAVESSLELRRTLSGSSPLVLNRLSGCWVIVDTQIPALWTRLIFAFACFCSPIEVASVNSPLRQKSTVMLRSCLSATAGSCLHILKKQLVLHSELICWDFYPRRKRKADRKSTFAARIILKSRSATLLNFAGVEGDLIRPQITHVISAVALDVDAAQ